MPVRNQRKRRCVKWCPAIFDVFGELALTWGSCYDWRGCSWCSRVRSLGRACDSSAPGGSRSAARLPRCAGPGLLALRRGRTCNGTVWYVGERDKSGEATLRASWDPDDHASSQASATPLAEASGEGLPSAAWAPSVLPLSGSRGDPARPDSSLNRCSSRSTSRGSATAAGAGPSSSHTAWTGRLVRGRSPAKALRTPSTVSPAAASSAVKAVPKSAWPTNAWAAWARTFFAGRCPDAWDLTAPDRPRATNGTTLAAGRRAEGQVTVPARPRGYSLFVIVTGPLKPCRQGRTLG